MFSDILAEHAYGHEGTDATSMDLPDAWSAPPPQRPKPGPADQVIDVPPSRVLSRLLYDSASRTLTVEFRNGSAYRYFGVSQDDVDQLAAASSPGARFNAHIAPYHENERIV